MSEVSPLLLRWWLSPKSIIFTMNSSGMRITFSSLISPAQEFNGLSLVLTMGKSLTVEIGSCFQQLLKDCSCFLVAEWNKFSSFQYIVQVFPWHELHFEVHKPVFKEVGKHLGDIGVGQTFRSSNFILHEAQIHYFGVHLLQN